MFCKVLFADAVESTKFGKCAALLWVEIDLSSAVPVGTSLHLPTPKDWEPACGAILARIKGFDVTGGVLTCSAEPIGFTADPKAISELEGIGYTSKTPSVVGAAYESVLR